MSETKVSLVLNSPNPTETAIELICAEHGLERGEWCEWIRIAVITSSQRAIEAVKVFDDKQIRPVRNNTH